jgi:hypothetical protein
MWRVLHTAVSRCRAHGGTGADLGAWRLFSASFRYDGFMKRLGVVVIGALAIAFAANPAAVLESAAPFEGAIDGISDITTMAHLPGYGLNVNARYFGRFDLEQVVEQLRSITLGLSGLIRGLDDGDVVSVAWRGTGFGADPVHVVVRMVPGDPSSLETFIDGEEQ